MKRGRRLPGSLVGLLLAAMLPGLPSGGAGATESPALRVTGMTFVGSRGSLRELVLRARNATFRPELGIAELEDVSAEVSEGEGGRSFSMTCRRAELNVETNDFLAEGDVKGATGDGRTYSAPWVRYAHDEAVLFTDAPVRMVDDTGVFRGDGFRYHVKEKRFQLLGNVRVEQGS
jgi:LPS export ABC transporter protein LptC